MSRALYDSGVSDKTYISEQDLEIMINASKEAHGNDNKAIIKGVIHQIQYAELVSNL
jgi:hypothetical protein